MQRQNQGDKWGMKSKDEFQIKELTKVVEKIKADYDEAKHELQETKDEYQHLIDQMIKKAPIGFYS